MAINENPGVFVGNRWFPRRMIRRRAIDRDTPTQYHVVTPPTRATFIDADGNETELSITEAQTHDNK